MINDFGQQQLNEHLMNTNLENGTISARDWISII